MRGESSVIHRRESGNSWPGCGEPYFDGSERVHADCSRSGNFWGFQRRLFQQLYTRQWRKLHVYRDGWQGRGAFSTTINFPAALFWANKASVATVTRSLGLPVVWNDAVSGTYVTISGSSSTPISGQSTSVGFTCLAPAAAGQFTVPSYVLEAIRAGTGTVTLREYTLQQQFASQGLDIAIVYGSVGSAASAVYQ